MGILEFGLLLQSCGLCYSLFSSRFIYGDLLPFFFSDAIYFVLFWFCAMWSSRNSSFVSIFLFSWQLMFS